MDCDSSKMLNRVLNFVAFSENQTLLITFLTLACLTLVKYYLYSYEGKYADPIVDISSTTYIPPLINLV